MTERIVLVDEGGPFDATVLLGALSSLGQPLGIVTRLEKGRPLPVLIRELTTLEHLAGGDLAIVVDGAGCDTAMVVEAIGVLRLMSTNEVTTFDGSHWKLSDAPNKPQPLAGPFQLSMLVAGDKAKVDAVCKVTGLSMIDPTLLHGQDGQQWQFVDAQGALDLLQTHSGLAGR